MIGDSHVAFVPNFKRYMRVIFRDRIPLERCHRCQICFFKFRNAKELIYHLSNGTCICKKAKPCRMRLEKDSFINPNKLLGLMKESFSNLILHGLAFLQMHVPFDKWLINSLAFLNLKKQI